jgi:predicted nicotinamide N-methyase
VTATDWAADAIDLLQKNAARNDLELTAERRDWREPWDETFDQVLAADVLYERRNVEPLVERLSTLADASLLALAGRPYEETFLRLWPGDVEAVADRVVRLTRPREHGGGRDDERKADDP